MKRILALFAIPLAPRFVVTLIMLQASSNLMAQSCGPTNHGKLPSDHTITYFYCNSQQVKQYDSCGNHIGTKTGGREHSFYCTGSWTPNESTVQSCANLRIQQCKPNGNDACFRDRFVYSRNIGWNWSPAKNTVCSGESFTQTSNCGATRQRSGTKNCCAADAWTPPSDSVSYGEPLTQTNGCGQTRSTTGTQTSGDWMPAANSICHGQEFTQTQTIGPSQQASGTMLSSDWSPATSSMCAGLAFAQTRSCGPARSATGTQASACIIETNEIDSVVNWINPNVAHLEPHSDNMTINRYQLIDTRNSAEYHPIRIKGIKDKSIPIFLGTREQFAAALHAKATGSYANQETRPNDRAEFCLDSDYAPALTPYTDVEVRNASCGTFLISQSRSCGFDTAGSHHPLCDECEGVDLTRTISYTNSSSTWLPESSAMCAGQPFTQTSNCGDTRLATGTGTSSDWSPSTNTQCPGTNVVQTNSCGASRVRDGTGTSGCGGTGSGGVAGVWRHNGTSPASTNVDHVLFQALPASSKCVTWLGGSLDHQLKWRELNRSLNPSLPNYSCSSVGDEDHCFQFNILAPSNFCTTAGGVITCPGGGYERVAFRCD